MNEEIGPILERLAIIEESLKNILQVQSIHTAILEMKIKGDIQKELDDK